MELTAALEALKSRADGESVELFTDSEYLRLGITQWMDAWIRNRWTRRKGQPVLNKDLWIGLHEQNRRVNVAWRWVKAHAGHTFNEIVDEAAREAAISAGQLDDGSTPTLQDQFTLTNAVAPSNSYSIAAVNTGDRRAAWAIVRGFDSDTETEDGVEEGASVNRALLCGVVRLMRSLEPNTPARVTTDSEYLFKGVTQWLDGWRSRGWRKADSKPIANKDLWIEIDALHNRLRIEWQLERRSDPPSHSLVQVAARVARDALELARP